MEYLCPTCKSDNIQRLSVIYEGGLSHIDTESSGTVAGVGRGGVGAGAVALTTTGTSQTAASKRAAPPEKKNYVGPLMGIFIAAFIGMVLTDGKGFFSVIISIAWPAASAWWIRYAFRFNRNEWPALKAAWDNSYQCNRCHEIFVLSSN